EDFEQLWSQPVVALSGRITNGWMSLAGGTRVRPYFCPGRALKLVHAMSRSLESATRRIRVCSPVITSGPILGTLAEVCEHGAIEVSGVYDATQMDEVQRQWGGQATASWKINAFHSIAAAGVALAALALVFLLPLLRPQVGTVVIAGSGRAAGTVSSTQIRLHGTAGWAALGSVSGDYPAAPGQRELLVVSVAVGAYDG